MPTVKALGEPRAWDEMSERIVVDSGLLQSWSWGEFQAAVGRPVERLAVLENNQPRAGWQIIEMPLPFRWRYFYIPRPGHMTVAEFTALLNETIRLAKLKKILFIRFDLAELPPKNQFALRPQAVSVQPTAELILNLKPGLEAVLSAMHPKTRYNIKLAEKHGVTVRRGDWQTDFPQFWQMVSATATRQQIQPHSEQYYRLMGEVLGQGNRLELWLAELDGKTLAAASVATLFQSGTYLHGGSSLEEKSIMAPYLLHWQIIGSLTERRFTKYNFGGVSETKPTWQGLTRFKKGFAPTTPYQNYAGVHDLAVRLIPYQLYAWYKKIR